MNRTELFDGLLGHIYDYQKSYCNIHAIAERYYGENDWQLLESITDEMLERKWVSPKKKNKYSVIIKREGKDIIEKYGSYSAFRKESTKNSKRMGIKGFIESFSHLFTIIGVVAAIVFGVNSCMQNREIKNLKAEKTILIKKIDSLQKIKDKSEKVNTYQSNESEEEFGIDTEKN